MSVREYIGARYVPLFMGDWDNTVTYEPLSIVQYQGNSYTSRQYVPTGIDITNTVYWAETGNYNAQVEAYRAEVQTFDGRIDALEDALPISAFENDTVDSRLDVIEADDWVTRDRIADDAINSAKIADGAVDGPKIADGAVNSAKIASDAVTNPKIADGAVNSLKIANGSITMPKLGDVVKHKLWSETAQHQDTNLVIFGDSHLAPNIPNSLNGYAASRLATALGCTLYNYAVAGAGFGRQSNLIATQISTAVNSMTTDEKNNTSVVIMMAGCNDLLQSVDQNDIVQGIYDAINASRNAFPYAKIVVVPFNWGFGSITSARRSTIVNTMNSIMTWADSDTVIVPYAWCWNLGIHGRFQNESHPNEMGYRHIVAHILDAIYGGGGLAFGTYNFISTFDDGSGFLEYSWDKGVLTFNGRVSSSTAGAHTVDILTNSSTKNAVLIPASNSLVFPLVNTNNRQVYGALVFGTNGVITASLNANYAASQYCYFNGTFDVSVGVAY